MFPESGPSPSSTDCAPRADAVDAAADRFLRRWAFVTARNMPAFAESAARWLALGPPPRLAADILPAAGFEISRSALPAGVWAVWTVEDGRYRIRLSPFLSAPHANFTLWHEWFDILAARPAFPHRLSSRRVERLADCFAACLTMPEIPLREAAAALAGRGDKSDVLAARFGVSRAALRRRLREVGLASLFHNAR